MKEGRWQWRSCHWRPWSALSPRPRPPPSSSIATSGRFSPTMLYCHGPDERKRKSKLRLDTEAGAKSDLGGHFAIVPGDAEERTHPARHLRRSEPADASRIRRRVQADGSGNRPADAVGCARRARGRSTGRFIPPRRPALPEIQRQQLAEEPDRPLCAGAAGAGRAEAFAGSRQADAHPTRLFRFDRSAADSGGSRCVSAGLLAERL